MTQTKKKSMFESFCNVGSGFIMAYLSWLFVIPVIFDMKTIAEQGLGVTLYFTTLSIVRGYIWRRHFNEKEVTSGVPT